MDRRTHPRSWPLGGLVVLLSFYLSACGGQPPSQAPLAATVDQSYLSLLSWRSIGPSRGGRVTTVAGDPVNKLVFYQGATGGGVWKTDDGGLTWRSVSDGYFGTGSVGAVAVAPSNPNVVYVGMGEACLRGNVSHGDGVYKSTDAGKTWTRVGLEATRHVGRIVIHPRNPDIAYVAALGDVFGPSPDRGVYRTRDGGRTWEKILYRDENTGGIDITMDPNNPQVIYASLLQERRFPWGLLTAGPGSGFFKTTDGGNTWSELSERPGLPTGMKGRTGITLSPARANRVWAIVDGGTGKKGVFRSDDGGATWRLVSDKADLTQRPSYYHHIFADPKDANTVYVLNTGLWKSTDGGGTWSRIPTPHGDNHDLWIDPQDPQRMVEANDGGATVSYNGGKSWSTLLNQPTAQLYHVIADNQVPYRVYAAQQDNTTISLPSRSDYGRVTLEEWYTVGGGEAGYIAPNTKDPNIVYAADHHFLYRYDHRTRQTRDISPNPETYYGWGAADKLYRFWWTYPVATSPHDPNVLYATSQYVHKTTNEGQSWEIISPDLTRHDPKTLEKTPGYGHMEPGEYWGPLTRETYGPEWYATIFAFAESPAKAGVLWAGSDDGYIQVSRDNGKNWTNVTPPDLPEFALMSIIDPSPHDAAAAYVAATRYKLQDRKPYLYKTADYGQSWTKIVEGIPDDGHHFTRVIREDPGRRGLLYAGTEAGVYVSFDDGAHWQSLQLNLPVVPVHDMVVKDGDLAVATHGRSFWILDNVALLHQFSDAALAEPVHLFQPKTTIRFRARASLTGRNSGNIGFGDNPPDGVVIPYYFKEKPAGEVTLAIQRELAGGQTEVVRTFSSEKEEAAEEPGFFEESGGSGKVAAEAGAHAFNWDVRYPGADVLPDAVFQGSTEGPLAPPGTYRVELAAGGQTYTQSFQIVRDPRIAFTDPDLVAQFEFLISVRDKLTETMNVVRKMRDMRKRAQELVQAAGGQDRQALEQALQALNDKLYPLEERLVQFRARANQDLLNYATGIDSKLARLNVFASMADAPPTQGERDLFQRLSDGVAERARALEEVERNEYAALLKLAGAES
ncbi:MAG: glycosyl hydrolase [Gemmatimonadetes bacterium]|nr:glycosyl hydrolase [Gemmatimonadota bacterium]